MNLRNPIFVSNITTHLPRQLTFISVISKSWRNPQTKTFVLDWNINMFLHCRHAFQMLTKGRVLLAWTWLMYSQCMYLLFRSSNYWELLVFLETECSFWWDFARWLSFYYQVIKCNANNYVVSEQIEYTVFLQQWELLMFWYQSQLALSISFIKQLFLKSTYLEWAKWKILLIRYFK